MKPPAHKLKGRYVTYSIVEQLGQAIVRGSQQKTPVFSAEEDLRELFGVSRSVVREALKILGAKGLVGGRPRQGTWIEPEERWNLLDPDVMRWLLERQPAMKLLIEFTQVRLAIEPMAASIAARVWTAPTLARIETAIERMYAAQRLTEDALDSDIAFHVAVLQASENPFFFRLEDLIDTALRISIRLSNEMKGVPVANVRDHERVMEAIRSRDAAGAATLMTELIGDAMELFTAAASTVRSRPGVRLMRTSSKRN